MINKELTAYIKAELELGKPAAQIKEELIANNWSDKDVEEAFSQTRPQPPQPSRLQKLERKLPLPLFYVGLLLFIPSLLFSAFTTGIVGLGFGVVFIALGIILFINIAEFFKFEGPLATKAVLIFGVASAITSIVLGITQLLDWPELVSGIVSLYIVIRVFVETKKLFNVSWLKTIGFYITYGIAYFIFGYLTIYVLIVLGASFLFESW